MKTLLDLNVMLHVCVAKYDFRCGSWAGLDNFHDGESCINTAILIIVCCVVFALIILPLVVAVTLLCRRQRKLTKSVEK